MLKNYFRFNFLLIVCGLILWVSWHCSAEGSNALKGGLRYHHPRWLLKKLNKDIFRLHNIFDAVYKLCKKFS